MKTRNRNLLAVALCASLASPLASAQLVDRNIGARANAAAQVPTRAVDRAVDNTRARVDRLRARGWSPQSAREDGLRQTYDHIANSRGGSR